LRRGLHQLVERLIEFLNAFILQLLRHLVSATPRAVAITALQKLFH